MSEKALKYLSSKCELTIETNTDAIKSQKKKKKKKKKAVLGIFLCFDGVLIIHLHKSNINFLPFLLGNTVQVQPVSTHA